MNKFICLCITLFTSVVVWAQKIEVVDSEGQGIPLVSVLDDEGVMIGTTNLNGELTDLNGVERVTLTHVAYKPQQVTLSSVRNGRITMEDIDYGLSELVVKPKPYIYVEAYYRAYVYLNDSLRYYQSGILPNLYDTKKKKVETGSYNSAQGYFSPNIGIAATWGARVEIYHGGKIHTSIAPLLQNGQKDSKKYFTTLSDAGAGRKRVSNPEGVVGYIVNANGQSRTTLNAGKMQMYRNKRLGENKQLKRREDKEYEYQFTEIFKLDEDGDNSVTDFVMDCNHWEWNDSKGHMKFVMETYATDHAYVDKQEWKDKKKTLKDSHKGLMSLTSLEAFATEHGIPALAPTIRRAIEGLNKKKNAPSKSR